MFMRTYRALDFRHCQEQSVRYGYAEPHALADKLESNRPGASQPVKPHREVLKQLIDDNKTLTYAKVAKRMGWKSSRSVAHKLKGSRDWKTGELERMCKIVGITMVQLAEQSSDMHVTKTPEALTGAILIDELSDADRAEVVKALRLVVEAKRRLNIQHDG